MSDLTKYIPPQDIELEQTVLGGLMIDGKAIEQVESILNIEVFYNKDHQDIYQAIKSLFSSNEPIDLRTVSNKLVKQGSKVSVVYLIELTQLVSSTANIEFHSRILLEKYIRRNLIDLCNTNLKRAFNEKVDVFDVLDALGKDVDGVNDVISTGYTSLTFHDAMVMIPEHVERLTNNKGQLTGVPTGLVKLDKHTNGWQPTDFIVIGADSGMGKTAFVMGNMLAAAKCGEPVGMFSMEMSVFQLAIRATAVESNYHMNQLSRNGFEKNEYFDGLNRVVSRIKDLPIHIDDKPALTIAEMKRKARALKRKHNIKLLVIDFLQMFSGDADTRIIIGDAARECKNLAKELNIAVIALSQLSREVRKSRFMLPQKYHLKEASAIEEAADIIGLIYRPGYYGYTRENNPDLYNELELEFEENACLILAKYRNGAVGNVGLTYIENKTKYVDSHHVEAVDANLSTENHFM